MKTQEFDIDQIPDAVLIVSSDGAIVSANRCADQIFDCERGRLVGLAIESLIPEKYRGQHERLVEGFFAAPSTRATGEGRELEAVTTNGRRFPVEIALGPTADCVHTVAVIRDITKLLETRGELRERRAEVRDLDRSFGETPIGLCLIDKELRFVRVNQWLADINGLTPEEHIGRTIADVIPDGTAAAGIEEQLLHVLDLGDPIMDGLVEAATRADPKTRSFMHNYFPVMSTDGAVVAVTCVVQDITDATKELAKAMGEIRRLRDQLEAENKYLVREISASHDFEEIVGRSAAVATMLRQVNQVAPTDSTVLVTGETGTGKELVARAIHTRSKRCTRPLVKVDCGTLPPGLIEGELFGHEKGAFTGAHEARESRFELAHEGTIFLDEIGELPLELQSRLLRVLEDGIIQRVGSSVELSVDVRVIAVSNRDLKKEVDAGRFRADLYYRLSVFPIECPSLTDRREDIPLLVSFFVTRYSTAMGKQIERVSQESLDALAAYEWAGNIRELRNVIERSVILCQGNVLDVTEALGFRGPSRDAPATGVLRQDLAAIEKARIASALETAGGKIKGEGNAAEILGLTPSTLRSKMKKLEITRP